MITNDGFRKFDDAVDIVCGDCNYRSEDTCETCPVRKTWDDMRQEFDAQKRKEG